MSTIWKFTSRTCLQTKCNQYFVMERRYSRDSDGKSRSVATLRLSETSARPEFPALR
jgi:hypothetical protein